MPDNARSFETPAAQAPQDDKLRALVARVGAFHITDKAMLAAQKSFEGRPEGAPQDDKIGAPGDKFVAKYLEAVRRYFEGFEREARAHLRDVDKRLEHANQVVFNLTAERGVAVKRIEATQSVLHDLAECENPKQTFVILRSPEGVSKDEPDA